MTKQAENGVKNRHVQVWTIQAAAALPATVSTIQTALILPTEPTTDLFLSIQAKYAFVASLRPQLDQGVMSMPTFRTDS